MVRSGSIPVVEKRSGVFISYARADGEDLASKLATDLRELGLEVWMDRRDMLGGRNWWQQIADAIGHAAYIVAVMTPAAMASEIVRREWDYARREGVCFFPVRASALDFAEMPTWMSARHFYDLGREWDTFVRQLQGGCEAERVPFMAPDLPDGYVERADLLRTARRHLVREGSSSAISGTVALHGSPGYGKTTLALALCHDEDVQRAFSDGILWMTLGHDPDTAAEVDKMHRALTGRSTGAVDDAEAFGLVIERLRRRRCLIVIDDAWRASDFSRLTEAKLPHCALLITTRRFDVIALSAASDARLRVDEMSAGEGVRLLTAGFEPPRSEPYEALVERLGGWPLLVRLARGALTVRLARNATHEQALAYVNGALTRHNLTAFDATNTDQRNEAATISVDVSLELLDDHDRTRWQELAVFPDDTAIPLGTAAQLWGVDVFEAEEVAERLANLSLVHLDFVTATVEVHDVLLSVARGRIDDRAPLHRRLVAAWPDLYTLPETDVYAWRWVAYHLVGAGQAERLRGLLLDAAWIERRLAATNVATLVGDYELFPDSEPHRVVQQALRISSQTLARDNRQITGQLLGRVASIEVPELQALVRTARARRGVRIIPLNASLDPPADARAAPPPRHTRPVTAVAAADGGRVVVSGSADGVLMAWEPRTGEHLGTWGDPLPEDEQQRAEWDRPLLLAGFPGRSAVACSFGGRLTIWDARDGQRLHSENRAGISALGIMPDGRHVLSGTGGSIELWDPEKGTRRNWRATAHVAVVNDARQEIITGSPWANIAWIERPHDIVVLHALQVWDAGAGDLRGRLQGHPCGVNALAVSPDGRYVASAPNPGECHLRDSTVKVWDLERRELVHSLRGHSYTVTAIAFTADSRYVISGGGNCFRRYDPESTVRIWDLASGEEVRVSDVHTGPVIAILVMPGGRWMATGGGGCPERVSDGLGHHYSLWLRDGCVRIWDLETREPVAALQTDDAVTAMVIAEPETLAVGSWNGAVHFLRFES